MLDNFLYAATVLGCFGLAFRQPTGALSFAFIGFGVGYLGLLAQYNGWLK
jgi:hypothetical protein